MQAFRAIYESQKNTKLQLFGRMYDLLHKLLYHRDATTPGFTVSSSFHLRKNIAEFSKSEIGELEVASIPGIPKLNTMVFNQVSFMHLIIMYYIAFF